MHYTTKQFLQTYNARRSHVIQESA